MRLLGIIRVGFDLTGNLLIRFSAFVRNWRRNGSTMRVIRLGGKKLVSLFKMCLNEKYIHVCIGKHLSDGLLIQK
jgi:hypothetical protein